MTARELQRRYPNASPAFIAANANAAEELHEPAKRADSRSPAPPGIVLTASEGMDSTPPAKFRLVVMIPIPPKELSPNARPHFMAKARAAAKYRLTAMLAGLKALPTSTLPMLTAATVQVVWFSRTAGRGDADNRLASLKAAFDGLADSGIFANDRGITHLPLIQRTDKTHPRVELEITA